MTDQPDLDGSDHDFSGFSKLYADHQGKVSDKWSAYLPLYDRVFRDFEHRQVSLLEIGVQNGGSLEIWGKFFKDAKAIVGCDINPWCGDLQFDDPRISIVVGDATSAETIKSISGIRPSFDIIIDDGSHQNPDIITTFFRYFPLLSDGGIYLVEDLHCSYWERYGGGMYSPRSSLEFFKRLTDVINADHWGTGRRRSSLIAAFSKELGVEISDESLASIGSIEFSNSVCVVRKASNGLGPRRIAGQIAHVSTDIAVLGGSEMPKIDESKNPWSQEYADPQNVRAENLALSASLAHARSRWSATSNDLLLELEKERELSAALSDRNAELVAGNAELEQSKKALAARSQLAEADAHRNRETVEHLYASTSWRITAPVRATKTALLRARRLPSRSRYLAAVFARDIWLNLPLAPAAKHRLKNAVFSTVPWPFKSSQAYANWKSLRAHTRRLPSDTTPNRFPVLGDETADEYVPLLPTAGPDEVAARLICFYLPQFHPIPENDAWWGAGFTEWTNVRAAQAQFEGHYQPRIPGELGYYSLLDPRVQRRQIELAKLYGIGGFCFYFYWFGGKRLLEKPVENYLSDHTLDFPFCLCWANENWSRRWDGLESEILIAQEHSPDDDIAFIREVARYFRDPRYIRVGGRPLLVVYRPSLLPAAAETSNRWRRWCRENGIGEIFLVCTQSFDTLDPATFGFDAAVEFPPNNSAVPLCDKVPAGPDFRGTVYDWRVFPDRSDQYETPAYPLFRSVCPSWDNTARRKNRGTILSGSTPKLYSQWLVNAVADTEARFEEPDERLVFVNAWNEWAEGAYLEPDGRYGYAYLQATRDALEEVERRRKRILLVTHDAHPHGAQFLLLNLAKHLRDDLGFEVDIVSLGGGPLLDDFAGMGTLAVMELAAISREEAIERLRALRMRGADIAIVNTAVSGSIVPLLRQTGFRIVSLIHEMPGVLKSYGLLDQSLEIARHSEAVVFPAEIVREGFEHFTGQPLKNAKIRPQGIYLRNRVSAADEREDVRSAVRAELKLASDAKIVLSVGYGDHRKGIDLFVDAIVEASRHDPTIVGVWVGHADDRLLSSLVERIRTAGLTENFRFPGRASDPRRFYSAADIFTLTSREDPFPSVVMEALDAGLAVVAFKSAGGFETLLSRGCGLLVDAFDAAAMATEINSLLADPERAVGFAKTGQKIIDTEFSYRHYVFDLLEFAGKPQIKISVIVPSYNYARFIEDRLRTITEQTYPIFELIVLDDCSTDGSQEVIERALEAVEIPHVFIRNTTNSGSVFHQWRRGVEEARGDLVWIAEADDLSDPHFLERVVSPFRAPDVVMSYCQSRQMADDGTILADHYLDYVSDVDPNKWYSSYSASGYDEITSALYLKNTVPNVSAVVFKRDALLRALTTYGEEITSFRNAGDWITYIRVLEAGGRIAFCASPLNGHRRHQASVTLGSFAMGQLREIVHVQRDTIRRFSLGEEAAARADAYAQRLYEQFGLATSEHPRFDQHPDIAGREENKARATEQHGRAEEAVV